MNPIVQNPNTKPVINKSKISRNPRHYFLRIFIVCFLLGLAGAAAAIGSDRHIHPEWSVATIAIFGFGISLAYAVFLAFVTVGCYLVMAYDRTGRVKWLLRSLGLIPLALSTIQYLSFYDGRKNIVDRFIATLPIMIGITIVLLLGLFVLSCFGWKHHANINRSRDTTIPLN